jgi:hypothetical protein
VRLGAPGRGTRERAEAARLPRRAVPSPDGTRVAVARHVGVSGYLEVGPARRGARRRVVFFSRGGCCGNILWASRDVIVVIGGYNRVWALDLRSRRAKRIAGFTGFHLSRDGRWLAGCTTTARTSRAPSASSRSAAPGARVPRRPKGASDWLAFFSADGKHLSFNRQTLNPYRGWTETVPLPSLRPAFKGDC